MKQKFMIDKILHDCLKKNFPKEKIPRLIDKLGYGSFKTWDSLGHLNLLMLIEKKFKFKFKFDQMLCIKTIKEIKKILKNK